MQFSWFGHVSVRQLKGACNEHITITMVYIFPLHTHLPARACRAVCRGRDRATPGAKIRRAREVQYPLAGRGPSRLAAYDNQINILTGRFIGPPHFESTLRIIREQYRSGDFATVTGLDIGEGNVF
jgi:hypothetical protein